MNGYLYIAAALLRIRVSGRRRRPMASSRGKTAAAPARRAAGKTARTGNRKIVVSVATSADGYIARADGGVDWLDRPRTAGDYGMGEFFRSIDTILWGRKTY